MCMGCGKTALCPYSSSAPVGRGRRSEHVYGLWEDGALPILIERTAQIKADADERLESYLWGEGTVVSTCSSETQRHAL
jgi:hypothetical protein